MQKIISLFQRNYDGDHLVRDEVVPGAEWVLAGQGVATVKYDGTCCLVREGKLYKRHDVKNGKAPPAGFEPAQEPDPVTRHWPGWVLVGDGKEDRWHREAFAAEHKWGDVCLGYGKGFLVRDSWADGTYELCGPRVNGNQEGHAVHILIPHGYGQLIAFPRDFASIKAAFADSEWCYEGVVWHHPDGRMVKIKVKDFGLKRNPLLPVLRKGR